MERDLDFWLANQSDVPFQPDNCQTTLAGDCEQVGHGEQEHHPAYTTLCEKHHSAVFEMTCGNLELYGH